MKKHFYYLVLTALFACLNVEGQNFSSKLEIQGDLKQKSSSLVVNEDLEVSKNTNLNVQGLSHTFEIPCFSKVGKTENIKVNYTENVTTAASLSKRDQAKPLTLEAPQVQLFVPKQQQSVVFDQQSSDPKINAAKSDPSIRLAGSNILTIENLIPMYALFKYNVGSPKKAEVIPSSPYIGLNTGETYGLPSTYRAYISSAAWDGQNLTCQLLLTSNVSGQNAYIGPYVKYEPYSRTMQKIGSGITPGNKVWTGLTFDKKANKYWAVWGPLLYSNSGKDTIFSLVDSLRVNGTNLQGTVKAIATNSNGSTFAIVNENSVAKLYRVNTVNASMTLIGNLGTKMYTYPESATFDAFNNTLYYENAEASDYICTVDTATGKATIVDKLQLNTLGLFHYHYTSPPPSIPTDVLVTKDNSSYHNLILSWKNPTTNMNDEAVIGLTKAYIYRGTSATNLVLIDSVNTTLAGEINSYSITEATDGVYYFGVQVCTGSLKSNISATFSRVYPSLSLPYTTSFENPLAVGTFAVGVGSKRIDSLPYSGDYAWNLSGANTGVVEINGFTMKKGAQYKITFMGRISGSSAIGSNNFAYFVNGNGFYKTITDTVYRKYEIIHLATADGDVGLQFASMNLTGTKFIDDVTMELYSGEEAPYGIDSIISILPNPQGALNYTATWYNPSLNTNGKPLNNLSKIIVERCTVNTFLSTHATYAIDTISTTNVGGKEVRVFSVPANGRYYFRFKALNSSGPSPYVLTSIWNTYAGKDTVPSTPTAFTTTTDINGKIKVSLKHNGLGANGGFLDGSINKYMLIYANYYSAINAAATIDTIYSNDTLFSTPVLPMGYYSMKIAAIRNNINSSAFTSTIYAVGGVNSHNFYVQTGNHPTSYSTSVYPLYFSTSENTSSLSQVVYNKAEMGGPKLIDSIYIFVQNILGAQYQKIYMGYKDTTFLNTSDYAPLDKMRLVFSDTIRGNTSSNLIKIPIKPFFYDGKSNLVVTYIKPKQARTLPGSSSLSVLNYSLTNRMLSIASTNNINFDSVFPPAAGTLVSNRPITVMNDMITKGTLSGEVKDSRGNLIANAKIAVKVDTNIFTTIYSAADGSYLLYLPANSYSFTVSSLMMSENKMSVTIVASDVKKIDFVLMDAGKVIVNGIIADYKSKGIAGANISLVGDTTYNILSDSKGSFSISNVYGATTYQISVTSIGYNKKTMTITLGDANYSIDTLKLDYIALPVVNTQAILNNNAVNVSWSSPSPSSVISWCLDSTDINSIGMGGTRLLIAQVFSPSDLTDKGVFGASSIISKVKFRSGDSTALYTLKIYQGSNPNENSFIYSQTIGKLSVGKHNITLTSPCTIDITKDVYIAMDVAAGYTGYPVGCDAGPIKAGKGGKYYSSGSWLDLPATVPYNWHIYTTIESVIPFQSSAYHVYRGLLGTEASVNTWTKLNTTALTTLTFTDNTFAAQPFGQYIYAVKADWLNNNLSTANFSNVINKEMEMSVSAQLSSNGAPLTNATVIFANTNGLDANKYTVKAPASGLVNVPKMWRGTYNISVDLSGHSKIEIKNVNITKDTTLIIPQLIETIINPAIEGVTITDNVAMMNWKMPSQGWSDDFESYNDFAIANIGSYILSAPVAKGGVQDATWPNYNVNQSYIVMNPTRTSPALNNPAHSGTKYMAAWYSLSPPNNDWLIRAIDSTATNATISFYAMGLGYNGSPETFRVLSSSKTSATADFVKLHAATNIQTTTGWVLYTYPLPAGAKYIAINCTSNDLFGFFVDDLTFSSGVIPVPKSFEIYLDGNKVSDTNASANKYRFNNLNSGEHTVGIKAIYYSGASSLVTQQITISNVTKPILPSVTMNGGNAVFTWDIPAGYTPTSYDVYLDNEKVGSVTEKTYTFMTPSIGTHTAGVVAVYGADKSTMTTANFKVTRIDDLAKNAGIVVYPNPSSSGLFNLNVGSAYDVIITQYNGQVIKMTKAFIGENTIDLSAQAKGVYFIKLSNSNGTYTVKIVK